MSRIKVLYHFSGNGVLTGSPGALLRMIESLDRDRFEPAFIGPEGGPLVEALQARGVETLAGRVESVSWGNPAQWVSSVREKRRLLSRVRPHVVHMNEPGWNSDLVLAAWLGGIPCALHLHNPQVITRRNLNYSLAKKVFLCSAGQKETLENVALIEDKLVVLHNAVDVEAFDKGRSIRAELGLADDALVVGTVAQIGRRKGIDIFLDAAELLLDQHPKLKFVIAGPPATNEEAYFKAMVERMQSGRLKDAVFYLGGRKDVPNVLSSMDVFFLPTRAEPFGMVIIEAMAAGVPVVASHVGGVPEIITNSSVGRLVRDMTPNGFSAAIDSLLGLGATGRRDIAAAAKKHLQARFDLPAMGATLARTYELMRA